MCISEMDIDSFLLFVVVKEVAAQKLGDSHEEKEDGHEPRTSKNP